MKKLISLMIIFLVVYVIYFDLSTGTLPAIENRTEATASKDTTNQPSKAYFDKKVGSGETVLSIVEKNLDRAIPVSIKQVVIDFQELNNGLKPEEIQYGKIYKFPDYHDLED